MENLVLSDEDQETVDLGDASRVLLDNPSFLKAVEAIRAQCAEAILTSEPNAIEAREAAYTLSRGLSAVTAELALYQSRAESIIAQALAQTEGVHQDDDAEVSY